MNWNDLKIADALMQEATLPGAGHRLGIDAATVARSLAALEQSLRMSLVSQAHFVRIRTVKVWLKALPCRI